MIASEGGADSHCVHWAPAQSPSLALLNAQANMFSTRSIFLYKVRSRTPRASRELTLWVYALGSVAYYKVVYWLKRRTHQRKGDWQAIQSLNSNLYTSDLTAE